MCSFIYDRVRSLITLLLEWEGMLSNSGIFYANNIVPFPWDRFPVSTGGVHLVIH